MNDGRNVLVIGAGDLGKQFDHFISNYSNDMVVGWLDDTKERGKDISNKTVLGGLDYLDSIGNISFDCIAIAMGYHHLALKNKLVKRVQEKSIPLYTFVHPTAYVDCSATICEGTFIYPNATIDQRVYIGEGSIINNNGVISHDSKIGLCSFLAPSVVISGNVSIGDNSFIGSGSIIKDSVQMCNNTQIGAGTLLLQDISEPGKYVGGPKLRKL